jgi:hypothetical protein
LYATPHPEGIARISQLGVDDGERPRRQARLEHVVVDYDDVDSLLPRVLDLGVVGNAAVHGDDEAAVLGGEFVYGRAGKAVFLVLLGQAVRSLEADPGQCLDHERRRRDTVGVPVAEDEDLFLLVGGEQDAVDGVLHLREQEGVPQETRIVFEVVEHVLGRKHASPHEYRRRQEVEPEALRQLAHGLGGDVPLVPPHSAEISLMISGADAGLAGPMDSAPETRSHAASSEPASLP